MTSTNVGPKVGGYRREVDFQKLGPALLIASSLVLAIRTAKWSPTHSDGLSAVDWDREVEHSARVAKIVLSHLTARYPTAIVSAWTSKPKNRNFSFMTGSLPLVALNCASF
jgi:hypothetical protein